MAADRTHLQSTLLASLVPHSTQRRAPVLLYGAPGAGKTRLVRWLASQLETVHGVQLVRLVTAELLTSRDRPQLPSWDDFGQPTVVVLDELESLADAYSPLLEEILVRVHERPQTVAVLGVSNRPWRMHDALRKCFATKLYLPMLDVDGRVACLRESFGDTPLDLTDEDLLRAAETLDGCTAADICAAAKIAVRQLIRRCIDARHFRRVPGEGDEANWLYMPCKDDAEDAEQLALVDIPEDRLALPVLTADVLAEAVAQVRPSVSPEEVASFKAWHEEQYNANN